MIEYRDGTFGEIEERDNALARFIDLIPSGEATALHIGSPRELQQKKTMAERMKTLEHRLTALEERKPLQSDHLWLFMPGSTIGTDVQPSALLKGTHAWKRPVGRGK